MKGCPVYRLIPGPGRIRLQHFLLTLVAFIGASLLVKYTDTIERLKQAMPAPSNYSSLENELSNALNKTDLYVEKLSINSGALNEASDKNDILPIKPDDQVIKTDYTELPSVVTEFTYSVQELKATSGALRESTYNVETLYSVSTTLKVTSHNPETLDTALTGLQATTSISERLQTTSVHSNSFVNGKQTAGVISCGNVPPGGLKEIIYNMEELETTFKRISPSGELWSKIKPAMTTEEKDTVRLLMREFIEICDLFNITNYFIFSGTLLGSYRHHGLQPWDDDIDILMQYSDQQRIIEVFYKYASQSQDFVAKFISSRMKLFHRTRSIPIHGYVHRWPFLDISFYHENETHIWELYEAEQIKYHVVPKTLIFPLHRRPFESIMINSPKDAFAILNLLFTNDTCVSLTWVHKTELWPPSPPITFECEKVAPIYPFVHRRAVGSCIEESLRLNDTVLYTVLIEEPTYAISMPFGLKLEQPASFNASPLAPASFNASPLAPTSSSTEFSLH